MTDRSPLVTCPDCLDLIPKHHPHRCDPQPPPPAPLRHTPGPLLVTEPPQGATAADSGLLWVSKAGTDRLVASVHVQPHEQDGNADLLALAPTAPHHCSSPTCPGDRLRRRLAALERVAELADAFEEECNVNIRIELRAALAALRATEEG